MSEAPATRSPEILQGWGSDLQAAICERCNWRYLLPRALFSAGSKPPLCPHCFQAALTPAPDALEGAPYPYPPEMVAPFSVPDVSLQAALQAFARGIPYAPQDLNFNAIKSRLTPIYLPMWLADANIQAFWSAQAGYNYEIISHQERYSESLSGSWKSQEVREPKIRWEPRVGKLERSYQNVTAPALEEAGFLKSQLGEFDIQKGIPYQPAHSVKAWVRLPDRSNQDAWVDAEASFRQWAGDECRQACAADHIRQFRWKASFNQINWTLLLLPVYTSYYFDDDNHAQPVLIHGQSGVTFGQRRASMKKAQQVSLALLVIGLILCALGVGAALFTLLLPLLAALSVAAFIIGIPALLSALIPIGIAWDFNRKQK